MDEHTELLEKVALRAYMQGAMNAARSLTSSPGVQKITSKVLPVGGAFASNPATRSLGEALFSSWKPSAALAANSSLSAKALRVGGHIADAARNYVVGSPLDAYRRARAVSNGKLDVGKTVGNLYKSHFLPEISGTGLSRGVGYASRALSLGIPAYQMYNAATGPEEERAGNIGAAAANIAISPISSQFGLLGQAALAAPASAVGRWIGNGFSRGPKPQPQVPVHEHLSNALTAQDGSRMPHVQSAAQSYLNSPRALQLGASLNRTVDSTRDPALGG